MSSGVSTQIASKVGDIDSWLSERETLFGVLLLSPTVIVFSLVSIFPIAFGFWMSTQSGLRLTELEFVGFSNFESLADDSRFIASIWTGIIYSVYSVALQMVAGVAIALLINKSFKFANIVRSIILTPYMVPTVAIALIFRWIGNNQYGILNYALIELGIVSNRINFFSPDLAMHSVVWISSWKFTLFVVLIILARLQSIDSILYEAAQINGASRIRQFFDVTYPQIRSALFLVLLLRSIWMFNKFDILWLLTGGGPFRETETMTVYAFRLAIRQLNTGTGAAITVIMFSMLLVTSIIYFKVFKPQDEVEVQ